jgi:hypothetical protein
MHEDLISVKKTLLRKYLDELWKPKVVANE